MTALLSAKRQLATQGVKILLVKLAVGGITQTISKTDSPTRLLDLKDICESVNKIRGVNVLVPVKRFCLIIILYYKTFL